MDKKIKKRRKRGISRKALVIAFINVVVIASALVGAYFVFLTPEKRLERSLDKAENAFADKDYDQAYDEYKKALDIDGDSIIARIGLIKVYAEQGRKTELKNAFDEAVIFIRGLDEISFAENKDKLTEIYLYAGIVYNKNSDKRIEIYEEAYKRLSDNEIIIEKLASDYMEKAKYYVAVGDLDNEVLYYSKVLEISPDHETAEEKRRTRITKRLEELISAECFDEADLLIAKFKPVDSSIDFDAYSSEVLEKRTIHDAKYELMAAVYEAMSAKDYNAMMELDGTSNSNFVSLHMEDSLIYTPETGVVTDYSGVGAAIFKFKDTAYYFYYGDLKDGKCSGNGVMFILTDAGHKSYYLYEGEWKDNKPEGKGTVKAVHEYDEATDSYLTREESGGFSAGLLNGKINCTVTINDKENYTGTFQCKNGKPKDISKKFKDYPFSVPEGKVLYAVLLNSDGSTAYGLWINKSGQLGVLPFVK